MFQKTWCFVDIHGQLCPPFPENGPFSFEQPTIPGQCRRWFSFHPLEGQTPCTVDRVDLFDIPVFHQDNITFVKLHKLVIHLIAHPPFPFLWQTVILLAGLPGAKADAIDVALWRWDDGPVVIGGKTERIADVRFGQAAPLAKRSCLIAEEGGEGRLLAKGGVEVAFALHRTLGDLVQMPTHPFHLESDPPLMQLLMAAFTQRQ